MTDDTIRRSVVKRFENVVIKLGLYVRDPNVENLHLVRTSIRRLQSACMIVPKSSQTKSSKKFIKLANTFFKITGNIRDYDIILNKSSQYQIDSESNFFVLVDKKRTKLQTRVLESAHKLLHTKDTKIRYFDNSKFERILIKMIDSLFKDISLVADVSNVGELHDLRKELKRLHYLLELEPTKRYLSIISNIRYLQRLLGDIHDSDIFIWYIQKHGLKIDSVTDIILQEKNKRDKTYAEMISYIKPLMHLG